MLEIEGLTCRYDDVVAVDNVTMRLAPGRVCGLIGGNGAGKTTTMRAVLGLVDPAAGSVSWQGRPIADADRRQFSYFPAQRGLYPRMRVGEQLNLMGRIHGLTLDEAQAATESWLRRLGVAEYAQRPMKSLSEGQQQRVQLAACFVHTPALAVLDEPFALLDFAGSHMLRKVLQGLATDGCAVLVASNQLEPLEDLCDDVTVLKNGGLVTHGALSDIRGRAGETVVLRFAGNVAAEWTPAIEGVVESLPREAGRDWIEVTLLLDPGVNRLSVLAAATAAGNVVQTWWGPRRLQDLYRDEVAIAA